MRDAAHEQIPFQPCDQTEDCERASMDNPFRKSSRARFPASWAALYDRKPLSHNLTPIGRLLRRISQRQDSLASRETTR